MANDLTPQKKRIVYNQRIVNPKTEFTVQDGINIQTQQLEQWSKVLKPKIHESLVVYATAKNHEAKNGFDITRGGRIDVMVHWMASGHLEILKKQS